MLCYEQERGCCVKNHYNGSAGFFLHHKKLYRLRLNRAHVLLLCEKLIIKVEQFFPVLIMYKNIEEKPQVLRRQDCYIKQIFV